MRLRSAWADRKDLKVPIIGDLRELRNEILKNRAIIKKKTIGKLKVFRNAAPNQPLVIPPETMENLVRAVKKALDDLVVGAGGADPQHRTIWHIT